MKPFDAIMVALISVIVVNLVFIRRQIELIHENQVSMYKIVKVNVEINDKQTEAIRAILKGMSQ